MIVSLHCTNTVREKAHDFLKKLDGMVGSLLVVCTKVSPPRRSVNCRVLEIRLACDCSRHMLHVNFNELSGFSCSPNVLVLHFLHSIFSYQSFLFQYLADGSFMELQSFLLKLPVNLQSTFLCLLSNRNHSLFNPEGCLMRLCLRFCRLRLQCLFTSYLVRCYPPLQATFAVRTHLCHLN